MRRLLKTAALAALLACTAAQADDRRAYLELGHGVFVLETPTVELRPRVTLLTLGYRVIDGLGLELAAGTGGTDAGPSGALLQVDSLAALRLRPYVRLGERVELYARVGVVRGKFVVAGVGQALEATTDAASAGAGLALRFTPWLSAVVDYTQYYKRDADEVYSVTGGLRLDF